MLHARSNALRTRLHHAPIRQRHEATSEVPTASFTIPGCWSPEQALAVFEGLQVVPYAIWVVYGQTIQEAWQDKFVQRGGLPEFDPAHPF